jgi:hypothetical protein
MFTLILVLIVIIRVLIFIAVIIFSVVIGGCFNKATGEIDPKGVFAILSKTVSDATKWLTENKKVIKEYKNLKAQDSLKVNHSVKIK